MLRGGANAELRTRRGRFLVHSQFLAMSNELFQGREVEGGIRLGFFYSGVSSTRRRNQSTATDTALTIKKFRPRQFQSPHPLVWSIRRGSWQIVLRHPSSTPRGLPYECR